MDPLVGIAEAQSPTHGRARSSRMRSRQVEGHPAWNCVLEGREAQLKPHTQPTAGGRTLVDADRISGGIGDPRRRRSNRARPPTADQLSTHRMAAATAVRVSEPCPSTSSAV
ncbi:hypothetical protein EVAR_38316_1 [Eumeta japonica]|uniref:Uncharacterized protein n=1 Tax=Eumeta variegata TaxID=151549 RepID=A0A4C1WAP1_EUMVA|nr:hypothetical protein EVAR_38316_1 [Eumeta japonica]